MKTCTNTCAMVLLVWLALSMNSCDCNCEETIKVEGKVSNQKEQPLADARVHVNGESANTNSRGEFKITVLKKEVYTVTVSKPGFQQMSKVFLKGVPDQDWMLSEAHITRADPTQTITATDTRNNCGRAVMARVRWENYPSARKVKQVQPDGSLADAPAEYEEAVASYLASIACNTGATVRIPPNSLEDESGRLPVGQIDVSVYTISLNSPYEMPGDLTVQTRKGGAYMKSYGAMGIDVINSDGKPLQLKDGATAMISIPIDPSVRKGEKDMAERIPLMFYEAEDSKWEVEGFLQLDSSRMFYQTMVSHFSAYNSDILKEDQACLRVDASAIDGDFGLTLSVMEYIGAPLTATRNFTVVNEPNCEGEKVHAIYNLPPNMVVMIFAYQPVDDSEEVTPIMSITFTGTEGPQDPTDPNAPVCPYTACKGQTFVLNPLAPSP